MNRFVIRRTSRRAHGQTLVLLALMLVVITGMIGLSVDVGNTLGRQRRIQSAVNAGAMAGMVAYSENKTNAGVREDIRRGLSGHGVDLDDPAYDLLEFKYVLKDGTEIAIPANQAQQANVKKIKVEARERVTTFFARVVGQDTLPARAQGAACEGSYMIGTYPYGVPYYLEVGHNRQFKADATTLQSPQFKKLNGSTASKLTWEEASPPIFAIDSGNGKWGVSGQHNGWMSWLGGGSSDLRESLSFPGNLPEGFEDSPAPAGQEVLPTQGDGKLQVGDWINGKTGTDSDVTKDAGPLEQHVQMQDLMQLPMIDIALNPDGSQGNGTNARFHVKAMGYFYLRSVDWKGNPKSLVFEYVASAPVPSVSCLP